MIPLNKKISAAAVIVALGALVQSVRAQERASVSLNPVAVEFAEKFILEGRVILDRKGAWRRDKPSTARENEFIHTYGIEEYGKWHLGIDHRHSVHSKAHFKFPFGDFSAVHRCGLLAVKARAHQHRYAEIEAAADRLLAEIEINRTRR